MQPKLALSLLSLFLTTSMLSCGGGGGANSGTSNASLLQISLNRVLSGFIQPTHITHAGDGTGRLFVVEQNGRIRVIRNGLLLDVPFLDIVSRVSCCGERGLLSVAFPPGFETKSYFYVNYTDLSGNTVLARYHLSANPDVADSASEEILLTVPQPFANHNGGQILFGPDNFLYIGMGDGGSAADPLNNGQNLSSLLGKMLRIDVESGLVPYGVPASNPFVSSPTIRSEIWSLGLRNPWRFAFDSLTGDLYIADVGQNAFEEVNFQPALSQGGENYGWRIMEGAHCFNPNPCDQTGLVLPVAEYDHSQGCSITGGLVYRGNRFPRMQGNYFFGDFCSGRIWALRRSGTAWQSNLLFDTKLSISTFGADKAGELYVADYVTGDIYSILDTGL